MGLLLLSNFAYPTMFKRILFLFLVFTFLSEKSVDGALSQCPSASNQQITSPCKFSPGNHSFETLTITSDVYLEMDHVSCEHVFNVTQGLIIQSSATIFVGFCEKLSGEGNGVVVSSGGSGASHGGRGGTATFQALSASQAPAYGSVFDVATHGSRGGGTGGGKGGGYIKLIAKKLYLYGIIRAIGEQAVNNGGGGSGGGVAVLTDQIEGRGQIEVFGGLGAGNGGGGAGGRSSVLSKYGVFKGAAHAFGGKSVAGTTPSEPEWKTEILKYAYGDDLKYSWVIPDYNKLKRLYLKVNDTYIYHIRYNTTFKKDISPKTICYITKPEKLSRICNTSIKPYSSVKDGKFNLVIKTLSMVLNNSTMYAKFDYPEKQNVTSRIYIMIEPLPPTTTPCPPHKYPSGLLTTNSKVPTTTETPTSSVVSPSNLEIAKDSSNGWIIFGQVAVCIFGILVIVLVVMVWRWYKNRAAN